VEITLCILLEHKGIKLELNSKRNYRNYSNTWRLSDTLMNDHWVTDGLKEETKKFLESNQNKDTTYLNLWDSAVALLRENFVSQIT
jgi:hypothetical protein